MREGTSILTVTALVIGAVGLYLTLRLFGGSGDAARNLLPYQTLVRTLTTTEQQMFTALRRGLPDLESERARTSQLAGTDGAGGRRRAPLFDRRGRRHAVAALPAGRHGQLPRAARRTSAPAWLLMIQEPEPNEPPDPAPLDEEHHRLPDGTTLHIYVWMHRYGGRMPAGFVPQPQANGWTEVFSAPPNPILPTR